VRLQGDWTEMVPVPIPDSKFTRIHQFTGGRLSSRRYDQEQSFIHWGPCFFNCDPVNYRPLHQSRRVICSGSAHLVNRSSEPGRGARFRPRLQNAYSASCLPDGFYGPTSALGRAVVHLTPCCKTRVFHCGTV